MARQQRRMEADGFEARGEEDALGDDQRHERHHDQIGGEGFDLITDRVALEGGRLAERHVQGEGFGFERIRAAAADRLGWREDMHHLLAAGVQQFQGLLAEGGLSDQDDAQNERPPDSFASRRDASKSRRAVHHMNTGALALFRLSYLSHNYG